jgi:hypothetical protein
MYRYTPDRPQRMAQMLAMQERNQSLNAPAGQRDGMPVMNPSTAYAGATPNTASGMPPQAMNFNGPRMTRQPGIAPQLGQRPRRVSPAGINTPQGGADRGDFDYGG